jgi:parallel beta-helix repeat protein
MPKGNLSLLLFVLLAVGLAYPYTLYGGALYCSGTCADCNSALNDDTYDTVYLNSSLSSTGNCIDNPSGAANKTFDCQGNSITGDGDSSGIYFASKSNVTVRNCEISEFSHGLNVQYLQLSHFDNLTILDIDYDCILWSHNGNSTLSNSTVSGCGHECLAFDYSGDNLVINSTFRNAGPEGQQAIELRDAINNTFIYNTLCNATTAIDFHYSSATYLYNIISNNTIYDVMTGISLGGYSAFNVVANNSISNLTYTPYNEDQKYFDCDSFFSNSCNNTVENNTGDGRPIYYYHDQPTNVSNLEAAELFLCNVDNSVVQNVTTIGGGMRAMFSENITINSSRSYNASFGIRLTYSPGSILNTISQENTHFDLYLDPWDNETWALVCDQVNITNVTGSGGRPINFTHVPVNWSNFESSEVFLCGANNSIIENATIRGSDSLDNNAFILIYSDFVTVLSSTSDDNYEGFEFTGFNNLLIANSSMSGNALDGFYSYNYPLPRNNVLSNLTASNNGGQGIYLRSAQNTSVISSTASGNGYMGIVVDYAASDILLDSNTIYGNKMEGIGIFSSYNVTVANNLVHSNGETITYDPMWHFLWFPYPAYSGIRVDYSDSYYNVDITLANNTVYGNMQYGFAINRSDNVSSTNDRVYGNPLADVLLQTDGTARDVSFSDLLMHSSDYPNVTIIDVLEASTLYTIRQAASPSTSYPGGLTAVQDRVINITNITGSPTIDTLTIAWGTLEESRYSESTFDLWRYLTSWVDLNATANTTSNTANYSSVVTQGAYGILGIYTYVEDEEGNDDECDSDSDCGECEECVGGTCELPAGACLNDGDCTGGGETCESCSCIPPECVNDGDCSGEGETCINYECVPPECTDDADCPTGYACENYECTPPECAEDADCASMGEGYTCSNYVCIPPECVVNEDCPACYECTDYACALPEGACLSDSACITQYGQGYTCSACECIPPAYECTYDEDCQGEGYISSNHVCYAPECTTDGDCGDCYECSNYECELPQGSCGVNSDCLIEGAGYSCEECSCIPPECTDDSGCTGDGEACENYRCVPPNCVENSDCPSGYTCENYECEAPECFYNDDCSEGQVCKGYICMDRKEERPDSGSPKPPDETEEPEEIEVEGSEEEGEGAQSQPFVSEAIDSIAGIFFTTTEAPSLGAGVGGQVQVQETQLSAMGWFFALGIGAIILYFLLGRFLPRLIGGRE